jgi:hypothetical protein
MQRLGRLLDQGEIQVGCRVAQQPHLPLQALNEWTEPLGPRHRSSLALAA